MIQNEKSSALYSWPIIILALIIFCPVGIVLLVKRIAFDKKAALIVGNVIMVIAVLFYSMTALVVIVDLFDGNIVDDIGVTIFIGAIGALFHLLARMIKSGTNHSEEYLAMIINSKIYQLDSIAASTGRPYNVVKRDVQKIIQKGYLQNAYIDESTRRIVISGGGIKNGYIRTMDSVDTEQSETRVVTCACCGANNKIVGTSGECEYCGSPL